MEKRTRHPKPKSAGRASTSKITKRTVDVLDGSYGMAIAKRPRLHPTAELKTESNVDLPEGPIMNLPNEILVRIFKMLPLTEQRRSRRVCKKWRSNLNTPTFFQHVTLCNAASIGVQATTRYLKVGINHETLSLTFSCTTRAPAFTLASVAIIRGLVNRSPVLKRLTFMNGRLPLESLPCIPSSVQTLVLNNVTLVNPRGKILKYYRKETEVDKELILPLYQEVHRSTKKQRHNP